MSIQLNQSYNIATIAHNAGFSIYNLNSIIHLKTRNIGSIKLCSILARSNIIALVGDGNGRNSFGSSNTVYIWDELNKEKIINIEYKTHITNIQFIRDSHFIVCLSNMIYIYKCLTNTNNKFGIELSLMEKLNTYDNPNGIFEYDKLDVFNNYSISYITLGNQQGQIYYNTLLTNTPVLGNTLLTNTKVLGNTLLTNTKVLGNAPVLGNKLDFCDARTDAILIAHKSPIVCLAINGYLVATASAYGTHIHIYDMLKKTQIHKLRRGFTSSNINGLLFSCDSTFIICYTDFSIHKFNLTTPEKKHISYEFELPLNMKISWLDNNNLEFIILYNGCNTISNTISNKNSKYFWKSMKIIDDVFTLTGFGHLLKPDIYDLFRINTSL